MEKEIKAVFLIEVGRNSVTFALHSEYGGQSPDGLEIRNPSILGSDRVSAGLEQMDLAAGVITDWQKLYRWLGSKQGSWATFTQASATSLVAHWLADSVEYKCRRSEIGNFAFVEEGCNVSRELLKTLRLEGISPDPMSPINAVQFATNFVVATRPLFLDIP